ncbi:endoplasmic reticulum metallopeptidase 1-like [Erpetoichthys calabaricus]|uniref:endoplasmic reticulum metallopeptidase 1-like n=1 Tax=Erpetoichthys calabaricus TaxID=27687 RepID=UPI002234B08A|nr:endoplasmic reticulum metallopeptidase 1-like [Erpetoichthys calabaricus]
MRLNAPHAISINTSTTLKETMENRPKVRRTTDYSVLELSPLLDGGDDDDNNGKTKKDQDRKSRRNVCKSLNLKLTCILKEIGVELSLSIFLFLLWALVQFSVRQLLVWRSTGEFNAERARKHLDNITAFGPRPVGSPENEILTVNYLLSQIEFIRQESNQTAHTITVDVQRPTGYRNFGYFINYYDNITNIVVKLEPRGGEGAQHAVLANCHFDSVPNSPGASDDAVSCSIMLEILRSLSNQSTPLTHGILFLFNGAEESGLQASHGFITQHPWAKLVRAFINLEAAGIGGKEIVFQIGPNSPWLVKAYALAAVHPFASVVGQDIFQSGAIPSITDFRVFTEFGNISGIDMAFFENGYLYHTKFDTPDRILTESIQRAGDNILAVIKHLATSNELSASVQYQHDSMVYFDLLGVYLVAYPARTGTIINCIVAVVTFIYLINRMFLPNGGRYWKSFLYIPFVTVGGLIIAAGIIAGIINLTGRAMFWYNYFYAAVFLYGSASVTVLQLIVFLEKNWCCGPHHKVSHFVLAELYFDVSLMLWSLALVYLTVKGWCSAYVPLMMVVFPLSTKLFCCHSFTQCGSTVKYLLGLSLPYMHITFLIWLVLESFCAILGRSVGDESLDIVMAFLITGSTLILATYLVPIFYLSKCTKEILFLCVSVFVAMGVLVLCGTFFPFSSDPASPRPKRIFLEHTTRTIHDLTGQVVTKNSGVWITSMDYTGMDYVTPHIPEINDSIRVDCRSTAQDCSFSCLQFAITKQWYLPAPEVHPKHALNFTLLDRHETPWGTTNLTFEVLGPSQLFLHLKTKNGTQLKNWSFTSGDGHSGERNVSIYRGLSSSAWHFWLEMKVNETNSEEGIISIAVASQYVHGDDQNTDMLKDLMQRFPDWSFPSHSVSTRHFFVF